LNYPGCVVTKFQAGKVEREVNKMDTNPPFSSPVKEYTQENYVCDENGNEVLDKTFVWKYNADNQLSEMYLYDGNYELLEITRYIYDNDHNLKEVFVNVAEGEQKKHLIYEYKDNKLDQITDISGDYKIVTRYDDYGNPIEKHNYTGKDLLISETKFINLYDKNNRLVEKHTVFPSGESDWVEKYTYNEAGLPVEEQKIRHQITSVGKFIYNDKGDLIESEFNAGMSNYEAMKREIVYDRNNDILEIQEYRKGWCYQDRNNEFGLTGVTRFTYIR